MVINDDSRLPSARNIQKKGFLMTISSKQCFFSSSLPSAFSNLPFCFSFLFFNPFYWLAGSKPWPQHALRMALAASLIGTCATVAAQEDALEQSNTSESEQGFVALPAVHGILRDRADKPVAGADIFIKSSGAASSVLTKTDQRGHYQIYDLPSGNVIIVARDPISQALSQVDGILQRSEQNLQLDLQTARADARIEGVILKNGKPIADASVALYSKQVFSDVGMTQRMTRTDAEGHFVFAKVMLGAQRLVVEHDGMLSQTEVQAKSGITQQVQLALGNSVRLPNQLTGENGQRVDVDWNLSLFNGNETLQAAYKNAFSLRLNGWAFPGINAASVLNTGREWRIEPFLVDGVEVSRQIFMPSSGAYVRYLEIFRNPSQAEQTFSVEINGELGAQGYTRVLLSPEQSNQQYALLGDSSQRQVLAQVFAGHASALAGKFEFDEAGCFSYRWQLTIPAGGSVALLHFALKNLQGDQEQLQAQAQALSALRQQDMLQGLSVAEKAAIKNFVIMP